MEAAGKALTELARLASEHRAAAARGAPTQELVAAFREALSRLRAASWDGALGEASELPDELMPPEYLVRRAQLLSDLEDRLGLLAIEYRSSQSDAASDEAIAEYHSTLNEMYRIGHWVGVPDPDSALPDALMPPAYHRRVQELIASHRAKRQR